MAKPVESTRRRDTGVMHSAPDADRDLAASVDALRRILRELRLIARKGELTTGLSPAQAFVLTVVADREGLSVGDIAGATMTDRSSAAAVIDRLVERGFADRARSSADRRRAVITATPLGRRALKRTASPPTIVLIDAVRRLGDGDRRALARGLTALTVSMNIAHQPAGMLFEDAPPAKQPSGGRRG
jgi:DNA-binding MarR family transcriptional regulator